jgi:hypothetical protein
MDAKDNKTIQIPMGNSKKEIDRLARSKGHHQILDVYGLFPY